MVKALVSNPEKAKARAKEKVKGKESHPKVSTVTNRKVGDNHLTNTPKDPKAEAKEKAKVKAKARAKPSPKAKAKGKEKANRSHPHHLMALLPVTNSALAARLAVNATNPFAETTNMDHALEAVDAPSGTHTFAVIGKQAAAALATLVTSFTAPCNHAKQVNPPTPRAKAKAKVRAKARVEARDPLHTQQWHLKSKTLRIPHGTKKTGMNPGMKMAHGNRTPGTKKTVGMMTNGTKKRSTTSQNLNQRQ